MVKVDRGRRNNYLTFYREEDTTQPTMVKLLRGVMYL